jgi:hypothetical protein
VKSAIPPKLNLHRYCTQPVGRRNYDATLQRSESTRTIHAGAGDTQLETSQSVKDWVFVRTYALPLLVTELGAWETLL